MDPSNYPDLTLREALFASRRTLARAHARCPACDGGGLVVNDDHMVACARAVEAIARGFAVSMAEIEREAGPDMLTCRACGGSGRVRA